MVSTEVKLCYFFAGMLAMFLFLVGLGVAIGIH